MQFSRITAGFGGLASVTLILLTVHVAFAGAAGLA